MKNLLKDSKAYYEDNDYYELFSIAEDGENKVADYLKELSIDKVVLDAGCGTGKFLPIIENVAYKYIGIDLSNEQLIKAKDKSKRNSLFINSSLEKIKLDNNSVDLIISTWVLGTITDIEERNRCLDELKRILKPNGKIILVENDVNSEFEEIRNRTSDSRTRDYNNWILKAGTLWCAGLFGTQPLRHLHRNVCVRLRCDFLKLIKHQMPHFDVAQRNRHLMLSSF